MEPALSGPRGGRASRHRDPTTRRVSKCTFYYHKVRHAPEGVADLDEDNPEVKDAGPDDRGDAQQLILGYSRLFLTHRLLRRSIWAPIWTVA